MRIKIKLILGFLIIALLIGIVGYLSINTSQKSLQESIGESSVILAQETLDRIDHHIYYRIEEFQAYSKDLILQETVIQSNQEFEQLDNVQDYLNQKDQEWTSVPKETITPFMQGLINNRLSEELREKIGFYEKKYGYKVFGEVFVTNQYGANTVQTGKTSDYYQADEEWWQKTREKGLYIADIGYDESADVYSTDIGIRIDDLDGNFLGVIKVVLNIKEAVSIIKELEPSKNEEYLAKHQIHGHKKHETLEFKLLTPEEKIIYSTEEFEFLQDIRGEIITSFREATGPEHPDYFIGPGDMPGEGEELFVHVHSKGYQDYPGLGWILIIEQETEEIFAPVIKLRNTLLTISIIILTTAILFGLLLSRSITQPIKELIKAASKIKKGNLNYKIKITSKDEIGELAQTFNQMRLGLKDRSQLLNTILTAFKGKIGGIAAILLRENIKKLAGKNPRILKIIPQSLAYSIQKEKHKMKKY